ncbi:MAG: hypothetical protein ABI353_15835 [Isosphaeraceae bacterium]
MRQTRGPSIREVRLVALASTTDLRRPWGERLEYGGRVYQVSEFQVESREPCVEAHYVHLRPLADGSSIR